MSTVSLRDSTETCSLCHFPNTRRRLLSAVSPAEFKMGSNGRTHTRYLTRWMPFFVEAVKPDFRKEKVKCTVCLFPVPFSKPLPCFFSLSLFVPICLCMRVDLCLHMCLHAWSHMYLEQTPTLVALSVCPMQNFCECVPSSSQLKHRWSDSETARETPAKVRPPSPPLSLYPVHRQMVSHRRHHMALFDRLHHEYIITGALLVVTFTSNL